MQYNHRQVRFRLISFAPEFNVVVASDCWMACDKQEESGDTASPIVKQRFSSFRYRMIYEPVGKVLNLDL